MEPRIGIGIPFTTWNSLVEESLRGCLGVDYANFFVVLVPNEGAVIPEEFLRNSKVVVSPTKTHSISSKRNQGWKARDCEIYACIDSDAYPRKDWLKNAVKAFKKSESIWAVGGPNISPQYQSIKKKAVANALKSVFVTGPRVFAKRISGDRYVDDLQTCNLLIKKEALEKLWGFDENLATAEDTDFCERVRDEGKKIYFSKDVLVFHHNRSLFLPYLKQKIVFGYAVIPFIKRHFTLGKLFIFLPFAFLLYVLFGWIGIFIHPALFYLWAGIMSLYIFVAFAEAYRWSENISEIPLTFISMIIGNIGPGIGTGFAFLGVKINFPTFYRNFEANKK